MVRPTVALATRCRIAGSIGHTRTALSPAKASPASAAITLRGLVTARWVTVALMGAAATLMATAPQLVAPASRRHATPSSRSEARQAVCGLA